MPTKIWYLLRSTDTVLEYAANGQIIRIWRRSLPMVPRFITDSIIADLRAAASR